MQVTTFQLSYHLLREFVVMIPAFTFFFRHSFSDGGSPLFGYCSRKEVFQPHLPVRLPCYDLAPVTGFTLGRSLRLRTSGTPSFHGLTGVVYKARERIHRS